MSFLLSVLSLLLNSLYIFLKFSVIVFKFFCSISTFSFCAILLFLFHKKANEQIITDVMPKTLPKFLNFLNTVINPDKKVFKIKTPIKEPKNIYTSKFSFEIKA